MKIVMTSINPLFPDKVIGGSTKHLHRVARYLGELGHDVVVLCTAREDNCDPFQWHDRVKVLPCFHFKQPFPQPYDMGAFHFANNIQILADQLRDADRYYMHDGEFLFPFLGEDIPTIISLRDTAYPETMVGTFLFRGDVLITISNFAQQWAIATAGRFLKELPERIITIPNGVDWAQYSYGDPSPELLEILGINPQGYNLILHPHRPEPSKGLMQTIEVVDRLVNQYHIPRIKTLVPRWFDSDLSPEVRDYTNEVMAELDRRDLRDYFHFHSWLPQRLMPEYYSLGGVTLALGYFVEAFGNVVYESLGCGTPSIAARVSTHRELLPDHLLDKVHFNDHDQAAKLAAQILMEKRRTSPETLAYLQENYGVELQLGRYADAILNAKKLSPMTYHFPMLQESRWQLPIWCYAWEDKIYHDFRAEHQTMADLCDLIHRFPQGFTPQEASSFGVSSAHLQNWYRQGYLVPIAAHG